MRRTRAFVLVVLGGIVAAGAHLRAHHSVLGFDGRRGIELSGVVREVVWANPHTVIVVDGDRGERWAIESEGAGVLIRLGWSREAIAIGDRVRTVGAPARNGDHRVRCDFVQTASGPRLPCFPTRSL
jgi:hypothetical protein